MGFIKKTWKNRTAEHPNRRRLTYLTDGKSESVEVALDEGTVEEEGDLFSAETMNDLETRIGTAIDEVFQSGSNVKASVAAAVTAKGQAATAEDTWEALVNRIGAIKPVLTGSAGPLQVLNGYTFYNTDSDIRMEGALLNRGFGKLKINCGQTVGITEGYYTGLDSVTANSLASQTPGTATTEAILAGKTAWVNGVRMTGTMTNHALAPTQINAIRIYNNRFEVAVERGFHGYSWDTGGYEYMTFAQVANTIGLTEAKIMKGNTILGIAGAAESKKTVSGITISVIATAANGTAAAVSAPYTGWYMLFKCDQDASFSAVEFKKANAGTALTKDSDRLHSSYAARAYICYLGITYA